MLARINKVKVASIFFKSDTTGEKILKRCHS